MKGETTSQYRNTSEYRAWINMNQRCYNKNTKQYKDYGGRGIKVCDRWRFSFLNFIKDMGMKASPRLTLDRINNNGDYTPGNCRWATMKQQTHNRRSQDVLHRNKIMKQRYLNLERGIYFRTSKQAWVACVQSDGKKKVLGQSVDRKKVEKLLIDHAMSM